ncbi:MAG: mycofactocin biosynthesis chaperone MftB [Defluviicoccus sp.]|nr:MAG: mycofactocin biosynthesis chaperone MftB [Defluviicoccus sp.]
MNSRVRYQLADRVAVRAERFGGLVYHYDDRRLYFLHSHELTDFVTELTGEVPLDQAIEAFRAQRSLPTEIGETILKSLAALERLRLVVPVAT